MRQNKVETITGLRRGREYGKTIYILLMGLLLLSFPYMMFTYTHFVTYQVPAFIWLLRCASSVLAIYLGRLWKDRGFQILSIYLLYILLRTVISNPNDLFSMRFSESVLTGIWAFTACYGLAKILNQEELKSCLRISALIWTLVMAVSCCVGIYAAWQGHRIYTAGDAAFWGLYPKRLMIPYLPTVSGALTSLSAMIDLCAMVCEKKKALRVFYIITLIPILLALSLTDSRTAFLSFAIGAGALSFLCLARQNGKNTGKNKKRTLLAAAAGMVICAGTVFLLMQAENLFHSARIRGGLFITNAMAETAERNSAARGFSGDSGMLTGRFELWKGTIRYLIQNPLILLFGAGKANPMKGINALIGSDLAHTHNLPLMILTESGIIGVAILLIFAVYVFRTGIRKIKDSKSLFPLILLPIIISVMVGDMAECFTWMASSYFPTLPFLFVVLGILTQEENA